MYFDENMLTLIEMHEKGQSSLYFGKDYSKNLDYTSGNTFSLITLEMTKVQKMKLPSYNCDETNSVRFVDCINEYYEEMLNCNLPWVNNNHKRTCSTNNDYETFLNISRSIFTNNTRGQIEDRGCFIQNCIQHYWRVKLARKLKGYYNQTVVHYLMPAKSKVSFKREIPLYTFSSFFAEVGGYLGLLVGESIFSFYKSIKHFMTKIRKI